MIDALKKECSKAQMLQLAKVQSNQLDPDQTEFVRNHQMRCKNCRAEILVYEALESKKFSPQKPLDDLANRRFITEILQKASALPDHQTDQTSIFAAETSKVRFTRRPVFIAVGVAAILMLTTLTWFLINRPEHKPSVHTRAKYSAENPLTTPAQNSQSIQIQQVMSSGQLGRPHTHRLNHFKIKPDEQIQSQSGTIGVKTDNGIRFILQQHSSARFVKAQKHEVILLLEKGSLIAAMDPSPNRAIFKVVTDKIEVQVVGTVFSVNIAPDSQQVQVLRGSVQVQNRNGRNRSTLGANQTAAAPHWQIKEISTHDNKKMWADVKILNLLTQKDFMETSINSIPSSATVTIDDIVIGKTPLAARIQRGHHQLLIQKEGYQAVKEQFDAVANQKFTRMFELVSLPEHTTDNAIYDHGNPRIQKQGFRKPAQSPATLLNQALSLRSKGLWQQSASYYEQLITHFPQSGQSKSALVSLGKLQLQKLNRPKAALRNFNKYLKLKNGPLTQEALYEKARALKKLNNKLKEKQALQRYIKQYPNAIQTTEAKQRLKQLDQF